MIKKFLQSSMIIYSAQMLVALVNYALIIIVSFKFDTLAEWTSANSVNLIVSLVVAGVAVSFAKRASESYKESPAKAFGYNFLIRKKMASYKLFWVGFVLVSAILVNIITAIGNPIFGFLLALNFLLQVFTVINTNFLLGILSIKEFIINLLVGVASRFGLTVLFIFSGFGILSLALGVVLSSLLVWIHSAWVVDRMAKKVDYSGVNFDLPAELKNVLKDLLASLFIYSLLYTPPIISNFILTFQEADLFAVLFNFGQIIHFGVVSFFGLIVVYAARENSLKMYLLSSGIVFLISFLIGIVFWLFGPIIFALFNRAEYVEYLNYIFLYALFITFFNSLMVSGRYLIGIGRSLVLYPLILVNILFLLALYSVGYENFGLNNVLLFIIYSLGFVFFSWLYIFVSTIIFYRKKSL